MLKEAVLFALPFVTAGFFSWLQRSEEVDLALNTAAQTLQHYETKQFGECWTAAVQNVKNGCGRGATEQERGKLAVGMANCHFRLSGLPTYSCSPQMTVEECTKGMATSDIAFNTYSLYSTHIDTMCFYIENVMFKQNTDERIERLMTAAKDTVDAMQSMNMHSKSIKTNIDDVLAKQVATRTEQERLSRQLQEFRDADEQHHLKIVRDLHTIDEVAKSTSSSVASVTEHQRLLLNEQKQFKEETLAVTSAIQTEASDAKRNIVETLAIASDLAKRQTSVSAQLNDISSKHDTLHGRMQLALDRHQEAVEQQQVLISMQVAYRQETEAQFSALKDRSDVLQQDMDKNLQLQGTLLQRQKEAVSVLQGLEQQQEQAFAAATQRLQALSDMTGVIEKNTREQEFRLRSAYDHIARGLQRLESIHDVVASSFFGVQTVAFYFTDVVLFHLLTQPRATAHVRPFLYLMLAACLVAERYLVPQLLSYNAAAACSWWLRTILVVAQAALCLRSLRHYQPPEQLMGRLLRALECCTEQMGTAKACPAQGTRQRAGQYIMLTRYNSDSDEDFDPMDIGGDADAHASGDDCEAFVREPHMLRSRPYPLLINAQILDAREESESESECESEYCSDSWAQ